MFVQSAISHRIGFQYTISPEKLQIAQTYPPGWNPADQGRIRVA
jgi:hypothetical protein